MTWETSSTFAYMIDGYDLASEAGIDDPIGFMDQMRHDAESVGQWRGTLLELWLTLFLEHRRDRHQSQGAVGAFLDIPPLPLLDELCLAITLAAREWRS